MFLSCRLGRLYYSAKLDIKGLDHFVDFTQPSAWYPAARRLRRKIICHVGPTNSGKTYSALQSLTQRPDLRGIYCAPLRLLAIEMYNKLNAIEGVGCGLRTGEASCGPSKKVIEPAKESTELKAAADLGDWDDASLLSCTVEMADINRPYDIAIIDEIQMMADPQRGWAFTQALLGLQAKELYLCGEEAALPLIQALVSETGDELEIVHFKRLSPLKAESHALNESLAKISSGDCVVTFSRTQIFDLKYQIERRTGKRCAVVYGNLPMESRSEQARLFNEPGSSYDVLVASDAIGMGLNLYTHMQCV